MVAISFNGMTPNDVIFFMKYKQTRKGEKGKVAKCLTTKFKPQPLGQRCVNNDD